MKVQCLVIQLARLGDTIQSLMALRAVKQLYPDLEITFVARERYADAIKQVPWIKEVVLFPTGFILESMIQSPRNPEAKIESLERLADWIDPLLRTHWDFLFNWTFSESSSYLTALIPARVKCGYSRQKDLSIAAMDGWSQYVQSVIQNGTPQNIHLTDIFTTQLLTQLQVHYGEPAVKKSEEVFSKNFFKMEPTPKIESAGVKRWIGFQLGASREHKTWPIESWATLATLLLRKHSECGIILFAGPGEQDRITRCLRDLSPSERERVAVHHENESFSTWASRLSQCQWIVTGDTAAVHLASVLGTRVLNLSIGPVRFEETGPYGNGHIVLRPARPCEACLREALGSLEEHTCRYDVSPEAAFAVFDYFEQVPGAGELTPFDQYAGQLHSAWDLHAVEVYSTRVRAGEEGGGVVYLPLLKRPLGAREWLSQVVGSLARSWYCGWIPPVGMELRREQISSVLLQQLRPLDDACDVAFKICQQAQRFASEIRFKSDRLTPDHVMDVEVRKEIQEIGKKLIELEQLLERLATAQPLLGFFQQVSKVLLHNMDGEKLSDIGRQSGEVYRQLAGGYALMQQWVQHTLKLVRPRAVPSLDEMQLRSATDRRISF